VKKSGTARRVGGSLISVSSPPNRAAISRKLKCIRRPAVKMMAGKTINQAIPANSWISCCNSYHCYGCSAEKPKFWNDEACRGSISVRRMLNSGVRIWIFSIRGRDPGLSVLVPGCISPLSHFRRPYRFNRRCDRAHVQHGKVPALGTALGGRRPCIGSASPNVVLQVKDVDDALPKR